MKRKYSIISGFLGAVRDRFTEYQPARNIEHMIALAANVKGCSGLEVVYPQNFTDPVKLKKVLDNYGLAVSTVNLNVKGEEKWRFGSFSSPDESVRKQANEYLKTSMDCAALLGCNIVTTAFLNDGSDYPFELDYARAFNDAVEGMRLAAEYRKDVRISLEYKAAEPRATCLLNNAGKTAYFCSLVDKENVGVTLDVGHALQCHEIPADSAAFLDKTRKLFHVHINDNYRNWDWDMIPGTVNLWQYIEFAHSLIRLEYDGWITADVFPQRHSPTGIMEKTFEWMDYIFDIAERIDDAKLKEMRDRNDTFGILDYMRSMISSGDR